MSKLGKSRKRFLKEVIPGVKLILVTYPKEKLSCVTINYTPDKFGKLSSKETKKVVREAEKLAKKYA